MSKFGILGVGNCGSQVALVGEKKYSELFDVMYINTSDDDLSMVNSHNENNKFKIGKNIKKDEDGNENKKDVVEGSGKNRSATKKFLETEMEYFIEDENFTKFINDKKHVFIIVSAAGGTGSGAGPILFYTLRRVFPKINFIFVGVLPRIDSSLMEHGNTLEYLDELYTILGDKTRYMIYDNETTKDLPVIQSLETVNENIIEDIRVLTRIDCYPTPYESIDEADMDTILSTPGRLLVARLSSGLTEKVMEDNNLDELIIKSIKTSCHGETERDKKVTRLGIITYFTEEVNKLYRPNLEGVRDFLGTPVERFNHNAVNKQNDTLNFMYFIAAGLSPINDRVKRIKERVDELKAALPETDSKTSYILSGDKSFEDITKREDDETKKEKEVEMDEIFAMFKK